MALSSMYESERKWRYRFMELAEHVASWSKDPSTKVGAVIVSGKEVLSLGYNGFASRTPDHDSYLNDREEKYPRVIHAEVNAVLRLDKRFRPPHPLQMFVTHTPCSSCASIIIAAGISEVIANKPSEDMLKRWPGMKKTELLFDEAGLQLILLDK